MIEEALVTFLTNQVSVAALIGSRIMPAPLRQNVALPAVSYQLISQTDGLLHDGPLGLPMPRIQLDCWGATYANSKALAAAVRTALHGYRGLMGSVNVQEASIENMIDVYESGSGKYRVIVDAVIQYQE